MATEKKPETKRVMTEEQKRETADRLAKAREAKRAVVEEKPTQEPAQPEAKYSEADLQRAIEQALAKQAETIQRPQVITVSADVEKVWFLWQAPVADYNVIEFGDHGMYGRITGQTGTFYVPKPDLSRIMTEINRYYIDIRWLVILSGLNEDEREIYGVNYADGEIIDKGAFPKLVELGDEILSIFPKLCPSHKLIVAQRYMEAYMNGSNKVTRDRVVKLNEMSKKDFANLPDGNVLKRGAFASIIDEMNQKDAK